MSRPRLGLALGSGSARGWSHIGILGALAERGLRADVITGASVGALVGAASAAGRLDALERWVCTLTQRDVWRLVDTTFRGGGVMSGNRLMKTIAEQIGDAPIESLPTTFGAVATDLYTGEEIWLREGSFMAAVRASSGLPGLLAPTWYQQRWLIDGGVVNPVPVSLCRALGADVVIAVDLRRSVTKMAMRAPEGLADSQDRKKAAENEAAVEATSEASAEGTAILRRWAGLVDGLVESFRSRRSDPGLFEVMSGAVNIMQDRITRSRLAIDPADLVLRPDLADFQLMDFHRAREAIEIGRKQVQTVAPQLASIAAQLRSGQ
ncbi:MAG: NTE family protein RssA [Candidatus Accumulibacter appositus]|uniref:NTE family protein RssA n=1 Tax=Candidatus Accumulibacter appositus TaxID=1454003 RepID=A0A011PSX9_9PROT|nr:patatin-like phospholipase family protein [Accumulibacter sp.]EXI80147.1 MAG: NTE family protein RssA [Candidatus Accumulibacter appositus]HRF03595.1 patatin-like phospholipase family protein [Accumulibacter sp.]